MLWYLWMTRICRSTKDLISLVEDLGNKGIDLKSLKEGWLDTATAQGKIMFTIITGLSQFERDLTSERTKEGLKSARARGWKGGRPSIKQENVTKALKLYDTQNVAIQDICSMCNISKNTLYNYIRRRKMETHDNVSILVRIKDRLLDYLQYISRAIFSYLG